VQVWFGGKLISAGEQRVVQDRLGSVVMQGGERLRYWPYGEERGETAQQRQKWATYWRDETGLDYAMARYQQNGRFLSPDPYTASGGPGAPQSWNRYAYVANDPINRYDPRGLMISCPGGICPVLEGDTDSGGHSGGGGGWGGGIGGSSDMQVVEDSLGGGGGGGGGGVDLSTTSMMRKRLSGKIDSLAGSNCEKAFGGAGISLSGLQEASGEMGYYDAAGDEGRLTVGNVLGNGDKTTLRDFAAAQPSGTAATTLAVSGQGPGGIVITGNVVLTALFGTVGKAIQDIVLLHEALHHRLQADDAGVRRAFGIDTGPLVSDSVAVTLWLQNDCGNNPGYMPGRF
jgi:RHS repeat-associated protein